MKRSFSSLPILFFLLLCLTLAGCQKNKDFEQKDPNKIRVVTTTSILRSSAQPFFKQEATQLTSLMGPGVDPHLYKPTSRDLLTLQKADIILAHGLHLEGMMQESLEHLKSSGKKVYFLDPYLTKEELIAVNNPDDPQDTLYDPHIWFDLTLWKKAMKGLSQTLAQEHPQSFDESSAQAFLQQLDELGVWVRQELEKVPPKNKILLTSHDAFSYFGKAYDFEVIGLQGISTVAEAGLQDVSSMVDIIKQRQIPAIFTESSVNPNTIKRVSELSGATIGGELYSDALGPQGSGADSYETMVRHNIQTIVKALSDGS